MKYHPVYEFTLNVPAEKAWALLEDFDNYSSWNSAITFKEKLVVGKTVIMKVSLAGRKIKTPIKVLALKKNQELRWQGGIKGLITGEHYFLIEKINEKSCKMIQGEKFSGVLMPIMWPLLKNNLNTLYEQTNEDIKKALA
jgi:hypothetical protein